MPSGVRARARAERERAAAEVAARRAREAEATARRRAFLDRLGARSLGRGRSLSRGGSLSLSKRAAGKQSGAFAARRRTQVRAVVAALVALNIVLWFVTPSWTARVSAIAFSVLVAPVLYTLLFRRS